MHEANTRQLFERFDHLYRGRFLPTSRMGDDFCCGDGWFNMLWGLSEQLEAYCQTHPNCADLIVLREREIWGSPVLRRANEPRH